MWLASDPDASTSYRCGDDHSIKAPREDSFSSFRLAPPVRAELSPRVLETSR